MWGVLRECVEVGVPHYCFVECVTDSTLASIIVTCGISFVARALSSIEHEMFCWTAISSAGVVGILPGFLICKSQRYGPIAIKY